MISLISKFIRERWRLFAVFGAFFYLWGVAEVNRVKLKHTTEALQKTEYKLKLVEQNNKTLIAQLELEQHKIVEMQQFKDREEQQVNNDAQQIKQDLQDEDCSRVNIPQRVLNKLRD